MLKDIILERWKDAFKAKDVLAKSVYESIKARILVEEKSGKYDLPLTDDIVGSLITKEIKELKETQSYYSQEDQLYKDIDRKVEILSSHLPKQLTEDEVKEIILKLMKVESHTGKLTGLVVREVGMRFDKSQISRLVRETLI